MQSTRAVNKNTVVWAVIWNQVLFTAGHSITSGGFLNYFFYEFNPPDMMMALLMTAPECSEALSGLGRGLFTSFTDRKLNWLVGMSIARSTAFLIPVALLLPNEVALPFLLVVIIIWYLAQGVAYLNYLSWLSDLVPEVNWGEFFAKRQLAQISITIVTTIAVGWVKYQIDGAVRNEELAKTYQYWFYTCIFIIGGILAMLSVLPLLKLPSVPWKSVQVTRKVSLSKTVFGNRRLLILLTSRWWLAFFQGMTQLALFRFSVYYLKIPLLTYYCMFALMSVLQLLMAWIGGQMSDANQDRNGMIIGIAITSLSMAPMFIATPETWWLYTFVYVCWGGFGMVNVCGRNLLLKLSPRTDNTAHLALYRYGAGLIAGVTGFAVGYWLDQYAAESSFKIAGNPLLALFLISWIGRATAPLILLWLPVQNIAESDSPADESVQERTEGQVD